MSRDPRTWLLAFTRPIQPLISRRVLGWAVPGAAFVALAWRQLCFVNRYAVNVLFFDQWGFYYPLFHGQGWWETFDRRHGPHREGVGLVVTRILSDLGGWNSRWDAFAVSGTLVASALLALVLLKRCASRAGFAAALGVPVLFFNVHQFEAFVGASNLSHGAMPVFLLLAFCLACFIRRAWRRLAVLSLLTFLLVFTGFGLFAGLVAPLLFALEGIQALRAGEGRRALLCAAALSSVLASWALFTRGYLFDPCVPNFHFPYETPRAYPVFVGRLLANFFGWAAPGAWPVAFGLALLGILAAVGARHARICLRFGVANAPRSAVLLLLAAYEIVYCASAAVGRVMLGDPAPLASRYVTLLIPAGLVVLIELSSLRQKRAAFWSCLLFAAAIAPGCLRLRADEASSVRWYHDVKARWKEAYLSTHSEREADRLAGFAIFPGSLAYELYYLEERRLNLFTPASVPK